jgi:hypothetical protein
MYVCIYIYGIQWHATNQQTTLYLDLTEKNEIDWFIGDQWDSVGIEYRD